MEELSKQLVSQAIDLYLEHLENMERRAKTIKGYRQDLGFWQKWLEAKCNGPVGLADLDEQSVSQFLLWLKKDRGYKASSRRRLAATTKGFLQFCYRQKWLAEDLALTVPQIKVVDKEREYLTPKQVQEWVNKVDGKLIKVIMWTIYYAGLRISEAVNLKLEDITFPVVTEDAETSQEGWIRIRNSKGGKHRVIPFAPKLVPILEDFRKWRVDSPHLFATAKTGWITTQNIQLRMREARERLGWSKGITPHTLRHSFASHVYQKTGDILVVSKLLGHVKLSTTQIYAHVAPQQLVDAMKVFERPGVEKDLTT